MNDEQLYTECSKTCYKRNFTKNRFNIVVTYYNNLPFQLFFFALLLFFVYFKNKTIASTSNASEEKLLTWVDIRQLAEDKNKCIIVIKNRVYDITKFIDEHPGGEEVLKEQHGLDATDAFEDTGHSSDAREQMKQYEIARLSPLEYCSNTFFRKQN